MISIHHSAHDNMVLLDQVVLDHNDLRCLILIPGAPSSSPHPNLTVLFVIICFEGLTVKEYYV